MTDAFKVGDRVLPVKNLFSGTGYIWEYFLFDKGWNDLEPEDKVGVVKAVENASYNVYWPAVDHTSYFIFHNEIRKENPS